MKQGSLLRSYSNPFYTLQLFLRFPTTWGICFRSADNPKRLNQRSYDTVLIQSVTSDTLGNKTLEV
jgi:hypothetical protein